MKFGTAWIPLFGEIFAAVAVVLAKVPREKKRQRFKSLKETNAGGFSLSPLPPPLLFPSLTSHAAEQKLKITHTKKTASYIYAGYKFVPYISGRLSLFLDPSGAVSLLSSLDAQGEKMSWRLKKKLIKTASYIYAGYKICSLHFWSFVSFSWSFRGCVFVIKPRCTRRENELETEKKKTDKNR